VRFLAEKKAGKTVKLPCLRCTGAFEPRRKVAPTTTFVLFQALARLE
jgi:hypothetical protein